jgi:hypothetical protein
MALEDRERLAKFIDEIYNLLRVSVDRHREWLPLDLRESYWSAFQALDEAVGATRQELEAPEPSNPTGARGERIDDRLERAGLTGAQLDLKLSGWRGALDRFFNTPGRGLLRRALRWGNVVLGSLAGAIGAAEAIKEFKETVEAGLEDEADEDAALR